MEDNKPTTTLTPEAPQLETNEVPVTKDVPTTTSGQVTQSPMGQSKQRPTGAIIAALIISAIIIALAVYAYMSQDKKPPAEQGLDAITTQVERARAEAATPDDVEETIQEVDKTLSEIENDQTFAQDELSDEALGL